MDLKPGSCLMLDIQKSPSKFSITRSSNYPYYLQITDALTRFTVLLGLTEVSSYAIFDRLLQYSIWFKPNPSFTFDNVSNIHADAGTAFTSKEFISDCEQYGIKVSLAAPRHQEMNGICERTWASIRNIAFSFLVHARVGFEFYSFALEHAWKVHACLPIKNLSKNDKPISPYEYFFGNKPAIRRFRVPFCPCVVNIDQRRDVDTRQTLDRRNHPKRGIHGIHVGLPRNSAGWLVYIPSTGKVLVSADVSFDEDFLSSVTYTDTRLPGGIVSQPPSLLPPTDPADLHHTEDPTRFSTTDDAPGIPCSDSHSDTTYIPRFPTSDHNLEPEQKMILDERYNVTIEELWSESLIPLFEEIDLENQQAQQLPTNKCIKPRRSKRIQDLKKVFNTQQTLPTFPQIDLEYMHHAYEIEVKNEEEGMDPNDFLPAPAHWKQILKLPEKQRKPWLNALYKELKLLTITMKCFKKAQPSENDPIIPVTAKFRTKIKSDGTVEKLKARVCLRGDQQAELTDFDTWCAIANFKDLRFFLAFAAYYECRIYQLDFIGAFLQAIAKNRVFTTLPSEWKELFPDLSEWFGVTLLLLKSIYGSTDSARNWDDTLSDFLINDFGFFRCPACGSINIFRKDDTFMFLINAVDDQLYFSNNPALKADFESRIKKRFDCELMGLAHWYLQARLNQLHNNSIVLDQTRYMALIVARFLPQHNVMNLTSEEKDKYKSPLPPTFVPTKKDCSADLLSVEELKTKHGFQYSSVVGMLIFLLNTAIILHYAIRKLAKFNTLPGKQHYKAIIHLLHHIRTCRTNYGTMFHSPQSQPPIYDLVKRSHPEFDFKSHPLLLFTDSSWQDCPDTSRSTGCYHIYLHGSLVDSASFVPIPIANSSAEAEYNAAALGLTAAIYAKQMYNSFMNRHPDAPLTIALFTDSQSAIAMMTSAKDTKRTRHIERRVHFVRQAYEQGLYIPYKIPGEYNPADIGTKNLNGPSIEGHLPVIHVPVTP